MLLNPFRIIGDLLHLVSILLLLGKMRKQKSCNGISLRTQELYLVVFCSRYIDIFWNFASMYNWILKIFFLVTTFVSVYWIRTRYKHTYDKEHDSFRVLFLIIPCFLLALFVNKNTADDFSLFEIVWAFSIYLESVAILPQIFLLYRTQESEAITINYVCALGAYRVFYLFNWIYRYYSEPYYREWIIWVAGFVQTAMYSDFFYYYLQSRWYGSVFRLPK